MFHDFIGLSTMVFLLGMKHGLDADHLAAIDGLARSNFRTRPRLARSTGLLFSLGHGAVVMGVALTVSLLAGTWRVPAWLDAFGAWLSIAVLSTLAFINIAGVLATPANQPCVVVGWRAGLLSRWLAVASAPMVFGVGALFALSFDTLSQATLFAMSAAPFGGWSAAAMLAGLFVAGMVATDGLNGLWIARLINRSDQAAQVASRVMGLTVGGLGLLTAAWGAAVRVSPAAARWTEGRELWFGGAVVGIVFASYQLGRRLAGSRHLSVSPQIAGFR